MKLTDAQLGRIARAAYNSDPGDWGVLLCVLDNDWNGAVGIAATGETSETPLMQVLREVAAEVDREQRKCLLEIENGAYPLSRIVDGQTVLDVARNSVACLDVTGRVRITNEHHGVCWTWAKEAER